MSEIITDINFVNGKLDIVNVQDVSDIKLDCFNQRRDRKQQGRQGLGRLKCQIPTIEILKAKNMGLDLYDKVTRDKWLKTHPEYMCFTDKGRSGKVIIKGN